MGNIFGNLVVSILEYIAGPSDPLNSRQAQVLKELHIPRLKMQPDKESLKAGRHPRVMYAVFSGVDIGTAYGHEFVVHDENRLKNSEIRNAVEMIREHYLHLADSEQTVPQQEKAY